MASPIFPIYRWTIGLSPLALRPARAVVISTCREACSLTIFSSAPSDRPFPVARSFSLASAVASTLRTRTSGIGEPPSLSRDITMKPSGSLLSQRAGMATCGGPRIKCGAEDSDMPLRDHFRPPLDESRSWEELHGQWPAMIVVDLNRKLPPRYVAAPRVHLGASMEIDVSTFEEDTLATPRLGPGADEGGVATAVWRRRGRPSPSPRTYPTRTSTRSGFTTQSDTVAWSLPSRSSAPPTRTGPRTAARL